jgi:16S rRNA (uracil1498-N3)-methyltransferase
MALRSVYLPDPSFENQTIRIHGEEHRHLAVARAETGEIVEVFDGKGNIWTVSVVSVGKRETVAQLMESHRVEAAPRYELVLAQALIKTAAFETALEKAVEIGVTRIVPFRASRSNMAAGKRHDRWLRIAIEAAKQSKRYHIPAVEDVCSFHEILMIPACSKIMFAERSGGPLKSALFGAPVLYMIGPEGGWTDEEMEAAGGQGFGLVSLGAGILKAETAAIVGGALIQYEMEQR